MECTHALRWGTVVLAASLAVAVQPAWAAGGERSLLARARQSFESLPADMADADHPISPARVALGRELFFEPRASLDGTVSCARCHLPQLYGTDGLPKARGVKDRINPRNAPTVLNAALEFRAHWRGDRENVEDQAKKALLGAASFGAPDYATAMAKLRAIPSYEERFRKAFPDQTGPITAENWALAIGAFERTLVTPAPFGAYLRGANDALSAQARTGLDKFMSYGCSGCHNGAGVGGASFQKFGVAEPYWKATGSKAIDKGRFDVTKKESDMYVFKVPSLRNVAMTPPYFHDGSVPTLAGDGASAARPPP